MLFNVMACMPASFLSICNKRFFDLLSNFSFLSVNPCGSGDADSHLLQRWACHLRPGLVHQLSIFLRLAQDLAYDTVQTMRLIVRLLFEEEEIPFCWAILVCWPVCLMVATLLPVDITFPGWGQHRGMQSHTDCQLHHLNNWVQLEQVYYPHTLPIDNFLCFESKFV